MHRSPRQIKACLEVLLNRRTGTGRVRACAFLVDSYSKRMLRRCEIDDSTILSLARLQISPTLAYRLDERTNANV